MKPKPLIEEKSRCANEDVALKSFFLGPQAENREWVQRQVYHIFRSFFEWRQRLSFEDGLAISKADQEVAEFKKQQDHTEDLLTNLAKRFESEIPKFSPRYIGHMFSEISLPALFGHILTILHNPNNISAESASVGIEVENESLAALAAMVGYPSAYGHFTSGGTVANYEMIFRARARMEENGGRLEDAVFLVPAHKHYSWTKGAYVFGIKHLWTIPLDENGHLDVQALSGLIDRANSEGRPIIGVVSVLGTTEMGLIDPIHKVQELLDEKRSLGQVIWHHIDAAYGAFFRSMIGEDPAIQGELGEMAVAALTAVGRSHSITLDPHKLGYVPYASGVFLCRDRADYTRVNFGAPYVNFSEERDKGLFTLEGSRSATGATATWMTAHAVGFDQKGYGRILARTIRIRRQLEEMLAAVDGVKIAPGAETNLLCFALARREGGKTSKANERTLRFYEEMNGKTGPFFVSKTKLGLREGDAYSRYLKSWVGEWRAEIDSDDLLLIRLSLMNPFLGSRELKVNLMEEFVERVAKAASS